MKAILSILFLSIFFGTYTSQAQNINNIDPENNPIWIDMMQDPTANFFATQSAFEDYWRGRTRTKGDGWKVFKRWEAYMETRVSADGVKPLPNSVLQQYQQMMASGPLASSTGTWTNTGPIALPTNGTGQPNGLGRVNDLAFSHNNSSIIWAGAPSGGLWKSTNGGSTWTGLTDNMPTLGVSSILIDTTNPNIMYMGTGDRDGGDAPGLGVYKSTNGGISWNVSNSGMGNRVVGRIIMNQTNHAVLIAATSDGIYKSTNSGVTWQKKSITGNFKDIDFKPNNYNIVYATRATSAGATFFRSLNGGDTWTQITSGLSSTGYRMVIGVSPANTNVVYLVAGSSSGLVGIYKSTNGGSSFSTMATSPNLLGYSPTGNDNSSQAYYDLDVAVDPTNANVLYVGGINIWKSTNGGTSWSLNAHWVGSGGAPAVHADHHCLVFSPSDGALYNGNDGGVYKTTNGGTTWSDISSGLAIAQLYKLGQSASNGNILIAGFQDNGTASVNGTTWTTIIGGDGMECMIDPTDINYQYGSLYYGDIRRSYNGSYFGTIAKNNVNGINESGGWITPYCLQEGQAGTMFIGYKNVWRSTNIKATSTNSVSWTKISTFGTTTNLRVIENSPADNSIIYVSRGGSLFRTDNAGAATPTWSTVSGPGGTITDLEAHPTNANIVYATSSGSIYKSVNKGVSWTSIASNLPTGSKNCLVYDTTSNEGIYVGMDIGVFYKDASLNNWINFSSGMPSAAEVTELEIFYSSTPSQSRIKAATYGRGVWSSDLYLNPNSPPVADFSAVNPYVCSGGVVQFTDATAPTPTTWQWSVSPSTVTFVNSTTSSSQNPHIQFNAVGNYTVTLIAGNTNGADTITKTNYVVIGAAASTPFNENLETFTVINNDPGTWTGGWTYSNSGAFYWRADNATTTSANTGPNTDHTLGTNAGIYLYTEASSPAAGGDIANLISPCITIPSTGNVALSFWYHMYGSFITGLHVDILHNGVWVNDIYALTGQQQTSNNSSWQQASVSLTSYASSTVKLRFRVIRGIGYDGYMGDVAIDDIKVAVANQPVTDFTASQTTTCVAGTVNFVDLTTNAPNSWKWSFSPSTVSFINSTTDTTQNPSVSFLASGVYTVTLISANNSGTDTLVKTNYITVNNTVNIPSIETFETFTSGTPGSFQNGWSTANQGNYPWNVNSGTTPSNYTGPTIDHTLGNTNGKYLYTEATGGANGNTAVLLSPCYNLSSASSARVSFWYHMYGAYITALRMDVFYNGAWIDNVKVITSQQQSTNGAAWLQTTVNLDAYVGGSVKVRFRAIHPGDYRADIAIDDFKIFEPIPPVNDEPCGAISLNVASTCTYTTATNVNATTSIGIPPPGCGGSISQDVWFKVIVPASGSMIIDADPVAGSFADGAMAAYSGTCSSTLTLLTCNDDYSGSGNMPHITLNNQTPGDTIFIRFWKYGGGTGQFKLCITEPPHFLLSPQSITVGYAGGTSAITVSASSTITWSVSDNVSWLTLTPALGTGNGSVTLNYSANGSAQRTATITGIAAGMPNRTVTFVQQSYVNADFTISSQMLCVGTTQTFINTSTNASSYIWYIDNVQKSTSTNYAHNFASAGIYEVKLKVIGTNFSDSTSKYVYVESMASPNAGSDTSICEGGNVTFNPGLNTGLINCTTSCNIPSYCASASNNDNSEHIRKVQISSVSNSSTNTGPGYEDFSQYLLMPVIKDSTYNITITAFTTGNWKEYVDVFVDWNRNGLFDEPAISLGFATFNGAHNFYGFLSVPSTAAIGKTKMRVIMKYANAIASGCETGYGYGETEDYMIDIIDNDTLPHSWTGPASFTSNLVNPSISNMATSQSGNYTLTTTNAYGCSSNDSKNITVNAIPNVTFSSINDVCISQSPIALTQGSPSGGVYSGTGVSSGTFNPATAGVGTHTITYIVTNGSGCSDTATQTVTVNPSPTVSYSGLPSTICISASNVTLTGSPTGGSFSGSGIELQNQFNPSVAGAGTHTIKYFYTDANSCSDSASGTIGVFALPQVNAGLDAFVNYGTPANLQATASGLVGSASYLWSPANMVVNANNAATATQNLYQSTTFMVAVTDNSTTCSDSDQVIIFTTGGPLVLSVYSAQDTICQGDSTQITALISGGVGTITSSWTSNPAGFTSTLSSTYVLPNQNTWYIFTASDTSSTIKDSVFINVNALPILDFTIPTDVCEGSDTVQITAITPLGGIFSGTSVVGTYFIPQTAGIGTHPITYTYTDGFGCTNTKVKSINVNALPTVSMTSLSTVCNTTSAFTLTNGSPYGGTYSGNGVSGMQFIPSTAGIGTHWIKYTYTDQNTCSNSDSTQLIVNSSPMANAGANQQINSGNTANLSGSASGGTGNYSYQWTPASMLTNANISNPTTVSLTASQLYQLKVVDLQTQCNDSDDVLITLIGGNMTAIIQIAQSPICQGDSTTLNAIGSGGSGNYTYSWTSSPGNFTSNLQNPVVSPQVTTAFMVMISDGNDSASTGQFVIVDVIPQGSLPTDTGLCANGLISLDAGGGYTSYQWSDGSSGQINQVDGSTLPYGYTNYYVTITNANGCSAMDSSRVEVTPSPSNMLGADTNICEQANLVLDAGANMLSYLWNTGDTTQTITVSGSMGQGQYIYWANVVNSYNCAGSDSITVSIVYCNSIVELNDNYKVKVYPNPSTGRVKIEILGEIDDDVNLYVFDNTGKMVYKTNMDIRGNKTISTIDLSNLAKGMYTLRLYGDHINRVQKLIIQ